MSKNLKANAISRRNFLKAGAIGGGIAAGFPQFTLRIAPYLRRQRRLQRPS
ncbi:MAG: twin-arginine translocation signal domain-containing protein [Bacilli bacterium]